MAFYNRPLAAAQHLARRALERAEGWPPTGVLLGTAKRMGEHGVADMAAGVAYYGLFSLFPLLLGVVVLLSFFLQAERVQEEMARVMADYLPGVDRVVVRNLVGQNIESLIRLRGLLGLLSLVGLLWSGSNVFAAVVRALDRAWGIEQSRPFHIARARSLAMVLGVAALLGLSLSSATLLQLADEFAVLDRSGLGALLASGVRALLGGGSLIGSLAIPFLLYRFAPSAPVRWGDLVPATLLAGLLFEAAKHLFILYLSQFAQFEQVYGSVSAVIALLLWAYISAFILILGAEFGATLGRWRRGEMRGAVEEVI